MSRTPPQPRSLIASLVRRSYQTCYVIIAALFGVCAIALVLLSLVELVKGMFPGDKADMQGRFDAVLDAIGILTIAVASLELSQTVLEEEVRREAIMSAPTRARRFLSRFLIVIVVALGIEALIATFQFVHKDPARLPHAAAIAVGAAALLAAWGVFVHLNRSAEELEPEAMKETKAEDAKVEEAEGGQSR